jgi:sec-independent protein translocase protein TatA
MTLGKMEIALLIVLVIILLLVGAKKLPELARGIGQSAKELKKGFQDGADDPKSDAASKSSDSSTSK